MNVKDFPRHAERGGAGVKLLLVGLVLFSVAHACYNYVPIAYEGESLKQDMQTAVLQGTALPSSKDPVGVVKQKLQRAVLEYQLPANTQIDVKMVNNSIHAHVMFRKNIQILPFGLMSREYIFDQTAVPSGFLMKEN